MFVGTLSGLPHGCSVGMDRVCGNVIMAGTWMLCGNGYRVCGNVNYHGCHMDALREWMEGCAVGMDRVCGNVIMVATWMLCGNGWRDALWEWIEFVGTLSWLPHGCSAGMDGVCAWTTNLTTRSGIGSEIGSNRSDRRRS